MNFAVFDTEPTSEKRSLLTLGITVTNVIILLISFLYLNGREDIQDLWIQSKEVLLINGAIYAGLMVCLFVGLTYSVWL